MPPTLDPPPSRDPDGTELMASLRRRIAGGAPEDARRQERYRPALAAVQALLIASRNVGGSTQDLAKLEGIYSDLQALARGF